MSDDTDQETQTKHYALFSGGHDSLVSTHHSMMNRDTDTVLHLNTGTGIPENQEYVEDTCEQFEWPLRIESPRKTLAEFAKEWGFPGSGAHGWAYRYFKAHSLQRVAADHNAKPHFWTGVRKSESDRRMRTVTDEKQVDATGRWVWRAPIADWSEQDCHDYIDAHDLPKNPVVADIHRSGECFCGSFAARDEELIDLAANYPDHHDWLMDVEQEVQDEIGQDTGHCFWGHSELSSHDLRALIADSDDQQMVLCTDCTAITSTDLNKHFDGKEDDDE
jgi:3'-phosphoadenosine 5'-phosphosulfate sulfotransferase (PAPS reductase)/FAD synthetase